MGADTTLGYILQTGAAGADASKFQQLVTIDAPRRGDVIHSCEGREGLYFLTHEQAFGLHGYYVHTLPTPGGASLVEYDNAPKMEYHWRSKKFVMPGRTTWSAAKVVHCKGCVRLRLWIDNCLLYDMPVKTSRPFRLIQNLAGTTLEIELIGTAQVTEVHVASTMKELLSNE